MSADQARWAGCLCRAPSTLAAVFTFESSLLVSAPGSGLPKGRLDSLSFTHQHVSQGHDRALVQMPELNRKLAQDHTDSKQEDQGSNFSPTSSSPQNLNSIKSWFT